MSHFIFIVFDEPRVVGVLDFLAESLNKKKWHNPPHLTIQGPLDQRPSSEDIARIRQRIMDDQLLIANPGIFPTKAGAALYLRVASENLRKVWNKPDYPVEIYGFNPHLTLYDGPDIQKVERAFNFLRSGRFRIEMICQKFSVVPHVSRQLELFPMHGSKGDENAISRLIALGKVSSSFRSAFLKEVNG